MTHGWKYLLYFKSDVMFKWQKMLKVSLKYSNIDIIMQDEYDKKTNSGQLTILEENVEQNDADLVSDIDVGVQ